MRLWAKDLTFLCLSFITYKVGMVMAPALKDAYKVYMGK